MTVARTALSTYDVQLVIVDRSASGSGPVMELFYDALGPPTLTAGPFSMWADWHGWPSHEQFLSHIVTGMVRPRNDANLSGTTLLAATATAWVHVTKVEFLLTDANHRSTAIAEAHPTLYGWVATWNTASVANGTYSLQSVASDAGGDSRLSPKVPITIRN